MATADAASFVSCDSSPGRPRCTRASGSIAEAIEFCHRDAYYCLDERILIALHEAHRLSLNSPDAPPEAFRALEAIFASGDILIAAEAGHRGDKFLGGVMVTGKSQRGEPLLAVGLAGPAVSNDHHPYYELLISTANAHARVRRKVVFFYDVAGIEGFQGWPMFIVAAGMSVVVMVPLSALIAAAIGIRTRHRKNNSCKNILHDMP